MADSRDLIVRLKGDSSSLDDALDRVDRGSKKSHDSFLKMTGAVAAGQAVFAIARKGADLLVDGITSTIKSAMESEQAVAQLNAVLESTGHAAGLNAEQLTAQADALQNVTTFSDEAVMSAQNLLLTFTSIKGEVFKEAIPVILDMSQALGQDLKSSTIQLGKALQDPIRGITALRRVGVNFSEDQQKVIAKLVETGQTAEAQRLILKELNTEFGGSAAAAANTFAGRLTVLQNQFDNVKEAIGNALITAIQPWTQKLSEFVASDKFKQWVQDLTAWIQTNLPLAIAYIKDTLLPQLKSVFETVWPAIKTIIEWLGRFFNYLSEHEVALWTFIGVLGVMKAAFFINDAVTAFQNSMAAIRGAYALTSSTLAVPIPVVIVVAAAIAALELVRRKAIETWEEVNRTLNAQANARSAKQDALDRLARIYGDPSKSQAQRDVAFKQAQSLLADKSFAFGGYTGQGRKHDVAGIVHKGEYVLPQSQVDQTTGTPKLQNSPQVNLTVNVGMYAGMPVEKREIALQLYKEIVRAARAQGVSMPMIGAVGVQ